MPTSASSPRSAHASLDRELRRAEHRADLVVRVGRVRRRQVHGHVEVVAPGLERGLEDRWVEARIAGVDDHVGAGTSRASSTTSSAVRGVDPGGADPLGARRSPRPRAGREPGRRRRRRCARRRRRLAAIEAMRRADSTGADDQHPHALEGSPAPRPRLRGADVRATTGRRPGARRRRAPRRRCAGQVRAERAAVAQLQLGQHPVVAGDLAAAQRRAAGALELVVVAAVAWSRSRSVSSSPTAMSRRATSSTLPADHAVRLARVIDEVGRLRFGRAGQVQVVVDLHAANLLAGRQEIELVAGHARVRRTRRRPRRPRSVRRRRCRIPCPGSGLDAPLE